MAPQYGLATTPKAEYLWVTLLQWKGKIVDWAPGAYRCNRHRDAISPANPGLPI